MSGIPSEFAFSALAGPIFSPARMNDVFLEIEPAFLPPFCSIIALYSSRECRLNVPLITIVLPTNLSLVSMLVSCAISNCNPADLRRSMIAS